MKDIRLGKVLEDVRALTREEQRQVQELLDRLLEEASSWSMQDELERKLLQVGLLQEVKPPITDFTPYQSRRPIQVKGKPVSEVIIEERR